MYLLRTQLFYISIRLLNIVTLGTAQDPALGPQSFLSVLPNLTITYSSAANCPKDNCLTRDLVPGACNNLISPGLNDNLGSLVMNGDFQCRVFSDTDCFGTITDVTKNASDFNSVYPNVGTGASSLKCGTKDDVRQELMLITNKVRFCTSIDYTGTCSIIYPYLSRCYDLSQLANNCDSVQHGEGLACNLYSQTGCTGSFVGLPIEGSRNLEGYQGFKNLAVSFLCFAVI